MIELPEDFAIPEDAPVTAPAVVVNRRLEDVSLSQLIAGGRNERARRASEVTVEEEPGGNDNYF